MKRMIVMVGTGLIVLVLVLSGCIGFKGIRYPDSDAIYLDQWLKGYVFRKIDEQLKTNSFMKDMPFLIVKAESEGTGKDIGRQIDALTEDIRDRIISFLLERPEVRVIRRHPVSVLDRPYTLQELKCGQFVEQEMLLTIAIKRLGPPGGHLARVNIRAIDLSKGEWIRGFSLHRRVILTPRQSKELEAVHPDEYLRGLKYAPFRECQKDEMGAYLARNLSCIFRQAYEGKEINIFIDFSKVRGESRDIAWFMKNQLLYCNEIQLTNSKENADWVLMPDAKKIGGGTGLSQFWVVTYKREGKEFIKGLATYAYFLSGHDGSSSIIGWWKIVALPAGSTQGFIRISRDSGYGFRGDLFGPKRASLIKRGIFIEVKGRNVDWAYYDDRLHKTFQVRGLLLDDGERMSVKVTTFPSSSKPLEQELVLEER